MIRAIMIGFALLLLLICANVVWQNVHCGTPVFRTAPLQIIPCESGDKLAAEIDELQRRARDRPER